MFTEIIYRPILNLTIYLYGTVAVGDLGVAIIAMTVLVRAVLLPLSLKTAKSQKAMAELAPDIEAIKAKHKGDTQAQSEAVMALYREKGVSPLAGCLPLVLQLPVLFGVYRVFLNIFKPETLDLLYRFVPDPGTVNHIMLGVLDISKRSPILAITAGVAQFVQARVSMRQQAGSPQATALNQQMTYLLPVIIIVVSWNLPAGLALYWVVTTLWSLGEQLYLRRR
ncbi:MAG: YidC/Oxa1 family membrane protein insertase [Candidatus Yanofskybacteria bacterium]|nr:YidC/Oxa1 family membrane protein insertase [Candidatus Yanofskybacteria bacterium]